MINTAKQFFSQRLQDIEKQNIYEDYSQRVGEIVIGVVHQVQRDNIFINIEQAELRLPKNEQIHSERYRRGDTIRVVIKSVEVNPRGPEIIVSRSDNHFLLKLFEMEVPEIDDGIVEIVASARIPGERAKIALRTEKLNVDPIGATVGVRGVRINAVSRELVNENIDCIEHSAIAEVFITRALSPAITQGITVDTSNKKAIINITADQKAKAIGKSGINIRLASMLTGYTIELKEVEGVAQRESDGKNNDVTKTKDTSAFESLFK
jgi:N utilization substance protein A